ncbi:hypothetical protein SUDANB54_00334 [Streptomyces sp. enrichment culture]
MAPDLRSPWTGDKPVPMEGDIGTMNEPMIAERTSESRRRLTPLAAIDPRDAARTAARVKGGDGLHRTKPVTFNSGV